MRDKKFLVPKLELGNQKNRWLSGAEAGKIASTPLSERLNLMTLGGYPLVSKLFI
ncbi:MAG: hypothetical protein QX196_13090 [Methylococcaceae bacterium]